VGEQPAYRLVRRERPVAAPPRLDHSQQAVVGFRGGPLLVLAGPGTGKTTTIVEAVVSRVSEGVDPQRVLVLTFSRRAAGQLRERITARLGGTVREPLARTFHSYAFGVLRREAALRGDPAPRLLSGAEQDVVVRDLLRGDVDADPERWPAPLHPALRTRGFAQELRDLVLRCYERGIPSDRLAALAAREGRADWAAAARFFRQYVEVSALRGVGTYAPAELLRAVIDLWRRQPSLLERERAARGVVLVDEFQDTDPAQVELLELLAGDGRDLIVVGDPDQSIYGFRGADVGGIREFPDRFRTRDGAPAAVRSLTISRRAGPALLGASRRVAERLGGPRTHRDLTAGPDLLNGRVEVRLLRSASREAAYVAARLREAHLLRGIPWHRMAVLVRSTPRALPALRRALSATGVPVAVSPDEEPLAEQPAVAALLDLARVAVRPDTLDPATAVALLGSPLGGADALGLRRLRQHLRRAELAAGGRRSSDALLVEAMRSAEVRAALPERVRRPAVRVATLLSRTIEAAHREGATAEDVLWAAWSGSGLAGRWLRESATGGRSGAAAERNLDAAVALFDAAARFVDRMPAAGPGVFLDSISDQQIPADTLAPQAPPAAAVHILTAHAAKGLEWDLVVVPGVQEGSWPDLRLRGSFLGIERLLELADANRSAFPAPGAMAAEVAARSRQIEEERRLFYVAVTRARQELIVTAVENEREALQPSRFLDELTPLPAVTERRRVDAPPRALSLPALVAELRAVLTDPAPDAETVALRPVAAAQLARLAGAGVRGADPSSWYGVAPLSDERVLSEPDAPIVVTPSKVASFRTCELRWFLESIGGSDGRTPNATVGTLVHAVAAEATSAELADEAVLLRRLDELIPTADLGQGWTARRQRDLARAMLRRLAGWLRDNPRELLGTEVEFGAEVGRARLRGRVDRLERDAQGRAFVVDLKTGSTRAGTAELVQDPQLGAYQAAVRAGAFAGSGIAEPGGAALVQLGGAAKTNEAREQCQPALDVSEDPTWAERMVQETAAGMGGALFAAVFDAKRCPRCPVRHSCPASGSGRTVSG
jgi:superfamily I DNA/RNA helicase/RecB family exonuclease